MSRVSSLFSRKKPRRATRFITDPRRAKSTTLKNPLLYVTVTVELFFPSLFLLDFC